MDTSLIPVWVKGLFAAGIGGGANAALAFMAGKMIGVDFTWGQLATVTALGALTAVLGYLKKSPLPGSEEGPNA